MKKGECFICKKETWVRRIRGRGISFRANACPTCTLKYYRQNLYDFKPLNNQSGSAKVGATIFLIMGFILFVGSVLYYTKSEDAAGKQAQAYAREAITTATLNSREIEELKEDIKRGDDAVQTLVEIMLKNDEHGEKLKQKIEWLEMKANNTPRASSTPSSLLLKQAEPLKVQVIYSKPRGRVKKKATKTKTIKKAAPKKKKVTPKKKTKKKVKKVGSKSQIRRIKTQLSELSH